MLLNNEQINIEHKKIIIEGDSIVKAQKISRITTVFKILEYVIWFTIKPMNEHTTKAGRTADAPKVKLNRIIEI